MRWWKKDRFGMFIHWGLYSLPARHEWVQQHERLAHVNYRATYFDKFDADLYDPVSWVNHAKAAGMKYIVLTTKHHDGFCLWDTEFTDFNATNAPAGRDLVKSFVDACRDADIKVGFYFSLIDWRHPDFLIDSLHPLRGDKGAFLQNPTRDMGRYRQFVKGQIGELLTNYGKIDLIFFDYSYPGVQGKGRVEWDSEGILKLTRGLQPHIIINDRLDLHDYPDGWDYVTPEQFMPVSWPRRNGQFVPWETCQTFSGSWGYHRDEETWKTTNQLIAMLIETVSKGGNLLLNVGPTARGNFDERATNRLDAVGRWVRYHGKAIYGCTAAPEDFLKPGNTFLTYNPENNRLYVHLLQWPFKTLYLPGFKGRVEYIQFLHDASEVRFTSRTSSGPNDHMAITAAHDDLIVSLPVVKPNVEIPVLEIFLREDSESSMP